MEELLKAALLGTAKCPLPPSADQPVDRLVAGVAADRPEWNLLLRAGATSVYQAAGAQSQPLAESPPSAPPESRPPCSQRAAEILVHWLDDGTLLVEAIRRLEGAGRRVPFHVLPALLDQKDAEVRRAMRPVIGHRGRWLGQFNEDWRWATQTVLEADDSDSLPPEARAIWEEGPLDQRQEILRRLRVHDADQARAWLAEVWGKEKADQRAELLYALHTGLSPADEDFLEAALDDRSKKIRDVAARFLARLPGSALAARMLQRADEMLSYTPARPATRGKAAPKSAAGATAAGALSVTPPETFDKQWQRDGIEEKPPQKVGKRAFWMSQILALVPPSHWEQRFQVSPAELIAAAAADDYGATILEAWSQAATGFHNPPWAEALWDCWRQWRPKKKGPEADLPHAMLAALLPNMSPAAVESRVVPLLAGADAPAGISCSSLLPSQRPWSVPVAKAYLAGLRKLVPRTSRSDFAVLGDWLQTLSEAAGALPEPCFAEALEPWELPEKEDYYVQHCRKELDKFAEVIRLREEFAREVPVLLECGDSSPL